MNKNSLIYNNKKKWKLWLFVSAAIAFVLIIYASKVLLTDIANEERQKVKIWADAVSAKAELVNYTDYFFNNIKLEEGKRAAILVKAKQKVNDASWDEDITFYVDIITANSTIPSIITNPDGSVDYVVNVDTATAKIKHISELGDKICEYDSLKIIYYKNRYKILYYKESQIYSHLRAMLNDLIESFFQEAVINNATVPVIITDSTKSNVIVYGNIDSTRIKRKNFRWEDMVKNMEKAHQPIKVTLPEQGTCYVFYEESQILTRLRYFPYIQFAIIAIFVIIAYLLFSSARRSEQNRVWVGMSKETAHQLGTPISSLMAWTELLKEQDIDNNIITEIEKDVHRLDTIAKRFSKIGSAPELKPENLLEVIGDFVPYLQARISKKITIKFNKPEDAEIILPMNRYLFEWVIENICKNSVDAIEGNGVIIIDIQHEGEYVNIDIADTGKGMPANVQKNIFKPGFTSKSRGWGLGLALAKRIIEEYHKGRIFILSSVVGKGTTMRISLKKGNN